VSEAEDSGNGAGLQASLKRGVPVIAPYNWELQKEQAWHKVAAILYALGASQAQIARELGRTPQAVCNLIRQPFFQSRVAETMTENSRDIMELFKAERINTLAILIELRDNPETPASVRAIVCKDILDRSMGKAVQRIEAVGEVTSLDPVAEVERLEAEVKRLRDEI
jgi:predicted transcriptional regulator